MKIFHGIHTHFQENIESPPILVVRTSLKPTSHVEITLQLNVIQCYRVSNLETCSHSVEFEYLCKSHTFNNIIWSDGWICEELGALEQSGQFAACLCGKLNNFAHQRLRSYEYNGKNPLNVSGSHYKIFVSSIIDIMRASKN